MSRYFGALDQSNCKQILSEMFRRERRMTCAPSSFSKQGFNEVVTHMVHFGFLFLFKNIQALSNLYLMTLYTGFLASCNNPEETEVQRQG